MPFEAMPFDPTTSFGPDVAAGYDDEPLGDEEAAVARLRQLAGPGPALELACASTGSTCPRRCSTGSGPSRAATRCG